MIASTPPPPYFAVIFTNILHKQNDNYTAMAERMERLAREQPGYLGFEHARDELGISVSYWRDLASIQAWKEQTDHLIAQEMGRTEWYSAYHVRIARVERDYSFHSL